MKNNDKKNNFLDVFNKFPFSMKPDLSMFEPATDDEKKQQDMMRPSSSFFKDGIKRFFKNKVSLICTIIILLISLLAFILPKVYPYTYDETSVGSSYSEPFLQPFEYSLRESIVDYNNEDVVFVGWSKCNNESLEKNAYGGLDIIKSVEYYNQVKNYFVTDSIVFESTSVELYPVWAVDLNHNNIADVFEDGCEDIFSKGQYSYTMANRFRLYYDTNNATEGSAPIDENYYSTEDRIGLIKDNLAFSKTGYSFIGWSKTPVNDLNTASEYSSIKSKLLKSIVINANTTIYAVWALDSNNDGNPDFSVNKITYASTKLARYKIYFNNDLVDGNTYTISSQFAKGDIVTIPNLTELSCTKKYEDIFPHVFGTDLYGRDFAIRIIVGTKLSLTVGIIAALMVVIIGVLYGAISGFFGGKVDMIMMRFVDIIYSLPDTLIIILLSVALRDIIQNSAFIDQANELGGVGMVSILIVFALLYWVGMARLVRGQVLSLREQEYVLAAKAMGEKPLSIIFKHMLPNCMSVIFISAALQIPSAIFTESTLSFLGLGVSIPMPSLGSLASDGKLYMSIDNKRYLFIIPAIVIFLIVLSLNLIGQGLRDAFDPKLRTKGGN